MYKNTKKRKLFKWNTYKMFVNKFNETNINESK